MHACVALPLADSADPRRRALVAMDPEAPAKLILWLNRDEHPRVRSSVAGDERLPLDRALEMLEDPKTCEGAAAHPHLPTDVMERIFADAEHIVDDGEGQPAIYLGRQPPPTASR